MRHMEGLHLEDPTRGTRRMSDELMDLGVKAGRDKVRTLMQRMRMKCVYRRPRTTVIDATKYKHPYLLRGLKVERPPRTRSGLARRRSALACARVGLRVPRALQSRACCPLLDNRRVFFQPSAWRPLLMTGCHCSERAHMQAMVHGCPARRSPTRSAEQFPLPNPPCFIIDGITHLRETAFLQHTCGGVMLR